MGSMQGIELTIQRDKSSLLCLVIQLSGWADRTLRSSLQRGRELEHVPSDRGGIVIRAQEVIDHFHRFEEDLIRRDGEACPAGNYDEHGAWQKGRQLTTSRDDQENVRKRWMGRPSNAEQVLFRLARGYDLLEHPCVVVRHAEFFRVDTEDRALDFTLPWLDAYCQS